jgi:hypothetical protein
MAQGGGSGAGGTGAGSGTGGSSTGASPSTGAGSQSGPDATGTDGSQSRNGTQTNGGRSLNGQPSGRGSDNPPLEVSASRAIAQLTPRRELGQSVKRKRALVAMSCAGPRRRCIGPPPAGSSATRRRLLMRRRGQCFSRDDVFKNPRGDDRTSGVSALHSRGATASPRDPCP